MLFKLLISLLVGLVLVCLQSVVTTRGSKYHLPSYGHHSSSHSHYLSSSPRKLVYLSGHHQHQLQHHQHHRKRVKPHRHYIKRPVLGDEAEPEESRQQQHLLSRGEHQEPREVSPVYPLAVGLLILGALFIPFVSLFFFLAVTAFNCQSTATATSAGLSSLTPIYGRRRRRRRSITQDATSQLQLQQQQQQQVVSREAPKSRGSRGALPEVGRTDGRRSITAGKEEISDDAASLAAQWMLFDSRLEEDEPPWRDIYGLWRKQLARSSVTIWLALNESLMSAIQDAKRH